jgi:hypothetical protein
MLWAVIAGGIILAAIGLAALYDYVGKRRHGWNIGIAPGPVRKMINPTGLHPDALTGDPDPAASAERDRLI